MRSRIPKYLSFFVVLLLTIPFFAIARPFRVDILPDKGKNFGCGTCHVNPAGGGARNPFGKDWEAIAIPKGDKYVPELDDRDSDGDSFTNDQEFNAKTHPGNPESKPEKPKHVEQRGKHFVPWGRIKRGQT